MNGKIVRLGDEIKESIQVTLRNMSNALGPSSKCTLVVRHQSDENAFMIFSEETHLEKVIETIQKHLKTVAAADGFAKPTTPPSEAL